jgi:hypothetical protein
MTGGMAGMGGDDDGGMGGVPDSGGMGGQGGDGPMLTLCERYCDAGAVASCTNPRAACIMTCEYNYAYGGVVCNDLMNALYECHIAGTAGGWMCNQNNPIYTGAECQDETTAAGAMGCLN